MEDIEITPEVVRKKIGHLKKNKTSGVDEISVNVISQCPNLDVPLSLIFTQSVKSGTMPQDWRDGNITPLFKK